MKTWPLADHDDAREGFAIDNVSRKRVLRIVEGIPGARLVEPQGSEICRFVLDDELFAITERAGGNARLLVLAASSDPGARLAQVRNYFEGYCL